MIFLSQFKEKLKMYDKLEIIKIPKGIIKTDWSIRRLVLIALIVVPTFPDI